MKKKLQKLIPILLMAIFVFSYAPPLAFAAQIRQEVNILTAPLISASGVYATSSEKIQINNPQYSTPTYYFEVVASTTAATNGTIYLRNATSSATVVSITINGTTNTRYRSSAFVPFASTTQEYVVVNGNESVGKAVLTARIVILQNVSTITNTETQIEIGSNVVATSSTATTPLKDPKYWYYDSTKWDASPTFYAEVSYKNTSIASSTIYNVAGTYTYIVSPNVTTVVVEAWGGGGNGGVVSGTGGGGGGGGGYAQSTTTAVAKSSHTLVVGVGGLSDVNDAGTCSTINSSRSSTYDTTTVVGICGVGTNAISGGAGGTGSTGQVKYDGGAGGKGLTTNDTSGGGGGAGGPFATSTGTGILGRDAAGAENGAGGAGDYGNGGAGGAKVAQGGGSGNAGVANARGGGGGSGAAGGNTSGTGGIGGIPGGGGGGSEDVAGAGGSGQIRITEYLNAGVALQESDGTGDGFQGWAFKAQIVNPADATQASTSPIRIRSAAFTPVTTRNYRIVASTTNATYTYDIYNAKIVVVQSIGGLNDSYSETNQDATLAISSATNQGIGQSFTSIGGVLDKTTFYLEDGASNPSGTAVAKIYNYSGTPGTDAIPSGAALATSATYDTAGLTPSFQLITLTFTGDNKITLTNGTIYIVTFEFSATGEVSVGVDNSSPTHTGNASKLLSGTWSSQTFDVPFYLYTDVSAAPTLLEPQYLLANTKLASGTGLQTFLTSWDSTEWSTTNAYLHEVDSGNDSTSVIELDTAAGVQVTNSVVTSPDNRKQSASLCMPANGNLDMKATTNQGDVYASRILVQVGGTAASCGADVGKVFNNKSTIIILGESIFRGKIIIR